MLKFALLSAAAIGAASAAMAQDASVPPPPPSASPDMSATPTPAAPDAGTSAPDAAAPAPAPDASASAPPPPPPPADSGTGPVTPATAVAGTVSWAGLYAGLNGGWGFDSGRSAVFGGSTAAQNTAIATGVRPQYLKQNRSGFVGGGQVGYNFVFNDKFVVGAEGTFDYMNSGGVATYSNLPAADGAPRRTYLRTRVQWMGSARARLGYALSDSGMFYVTGGYAFGRISGRTEFNGTAAQPINYAGSHSYIGQGWIAGGGLEFRPFSEGMLSKVTVGIEGTYYDLGRSHIYAGPVGATAVGVYTTTLHTRGVNGVGRISYHF